MSLQRFQRTKTGAIATMVIVALSAWLLATGLLHGTSYLLMPVALAAGAIVLFQTLKNWRRGVLFFLVWLLFEDLVRKNMSNNMLVYFGKDVVAAACFLGFYLSRDYKRIFSGKPAFIFWFWCFFAWGVVEAFNFNSPSVLYGVLGLKLYFEFVPLFLLGYALLQSEKDLRQFLGLNLSVAGLIALLGVLQAVTGQVLLSPAELAPDIRQLGNLMRFAPVSHVYFLRPPSVFVSDGRFGAYLLLAWLVGLGTGGYFFLKRLPEKKWVVLILGVIIAAILLSGVRGALMYALISLVVICSAYIREMARHVLARKVARALALTFFVVVLALIFLSIAYPEVFAPRLAFYTETLLPSSSSSQLGWRAWGYPVSEFVKTFNYPNWLLGNGTGTCSLGTQYLTRILDVPPSRLGVESGYGNIVLEMGLPGLFLWLALTTSLISCAWKVVRQLRGTPLFPLGLVIWLFSFITLFPSMASGLGIENYVVSAFLFLLLGILFSLPALSGAKVASAGTPSLQEHNRRVTLRRPAGESVPLST